MVSSFHHNLLRTKSHKSYIPPEVLDNENDGDVIRGKWLNNAGPYVVLLKNKRGGLMSLSGVTSI